MWVRRFHLPEAEKLNGRAAMLGYVAALLVDQATGVGILDQQESFLGKLVLHLTVFGVLLVRSSSDIEKYKNLLDEATFYDKQVCGCVFAWAWVCRGVEHDVEQYLVGRWVVGVCTFVSSTTPVCIYLLYFNTATHDPPHIFPTTQPPSSFSHSGMQPGKARCVPLKPKRHSERASGASSYARRVCIHLVHTRRMVYNQGIPVPVGWCIT